MANENKLTTVGQMKTFAQQQDARDDQQDEKIKQLDEENDVFLKFTQQTLTEAQQAQARENIGAAEEGNVEPISDEEIEEVLSGAVEADGSMVPAVLYEQQTLTEAQQAQARANIGAGKEYAVENLTSQIVLNFPDNCTFQLRNCYRYGRVCTFTIQVNVTTAISDSYGFTFATMPVAPISRVWINNETRFYMDTDNRAIRVNGTSLAVGNYILTGFFLTYE